MGIRKLTAASQQKLIGCYLYATGFQHSSPAQQLEISTEFSKCLKSTRRDKIDASDLIYVYLVDPSNLPAHLLERVLPEGLPASVVCDEAEIDRISIVFLTVTQRLGSKLLWGLALVKLAFTRRHMWRRSLLLLLLKPAGNRLLRPMDRLL